MSGEISAPGDAFSLEAQRNDTLKGQTPPNGLTDGELSKLLDDAWGRPGDQNSRLPLDRDWEQIAKQVQHRYRLLIQEAYPAVLSGFKVEPAAALSIAATDVFVEKAQHRLTRRAGMLVAVGSATAFAAATLLLGAALYLFRSGPPTPLPEAADRNFWLVLHLLKTVSAGGFAGAGAYYLGGLSRALLHESTVLYNRRHALRFGRLYVYLQGGKVDASRLHELFRWNDSPESAFRDIDPRILKQVGLSRVIDLLPELIKSLSEGLRGVAASAKR